MSQIYSIESLLFVSGKPLSIKKISALLNVGVEEVEDCINQLMEVYSQEKRGIVLVRNGLDVQFATNPVCAELVKEYLKEDTVSELSRPALETLAVIAYRGPVSKYEIEQIRGVNCSMSLRNLLIRGLIEEKEDKSTLSKMYNLSFDFMNHLGVQQLSQLPDFAKLSTDNRVNLILNDSSENKDDDSNNNSEEI